MPSTLLEKILKQLFKYGKLNPTTNEAMNLNLDSTRAPTDKCCNVV